MTRKERAFTMEGAAILFALTLLLFVIPALLSSRDSMAVFAGGFLAAGFAGWAVYFIYRINRESSK